MADMLNSELHDALREAGASEKASRAAARSTAKSSGTTAKALIWVKVLLGTMGVLAVINVLMLNQLFTLTAETANNRVNIAALQKRVDELKEKQWAIERGHREVGNFPRASHSKNAADNSDAAPEISAAPRTPDP